MLKIRHTEHVTNIRVKEIIGVKRNWFEDLARKLWYAGHIIRGSSDGVVQLVLGYNEWKKGEGRPRRIWDDDIKKCLTEEQHEESKDLRK